VLKFAKAKGHVTTSAADIRDDMKLLLPRTNGANKHFAALPYEGIPAFVRERSQSCVDVGAAYLADVLLAQSGSVGEQE
jgi:hypothetical protein